MSASIATPTLMEIGSDGTLSGSNRTYVKVLGDMASVYHDDAAFAAALEAAGADTLVYQVEEQRYDSEEGSLIVGTSTLLPGRIGDEYAVTRGHLHAKSDRAELYYCLSGHGVMLLETGDGRSEAVELTPGKAVNVPGHWIHRSVNVGDVPFVTLFTYSADAGQNYGIIGDASGMSVLVVADEDSGWTTVPNPQHSGYTVASA